MVQRRDQDIRHAYTQLTNVADIVQSKTVELFSDAQTVLITLAQFDAIRGTNDAACEHALQRIFHQFPRYTNFSKADLDGNIVCSSTPLTSPLNVSYSSFFQSVVRKDIFSISRFRIGPLHKKPIVIFSLPIHDETEKQVSIISTALSLDWLKSVFDRISIPEYYQIIMFDENGIVLASTSSLNISIGDNISDTAIYRESVTSQSSQFSFVDEYEKTILAGKSLVIDVPGNVSIIAMAPEKYVVAQVERSFILQISMLITTLFFSFGVAWFASHKLILDKITVLSHQAARLAAGDMKARSPNTESKDELAELARTFNGMAVQFQRREIALRETIKDKELLLKEIHHRVKNNLQVVSGLIRLRQNGVVDTETQSFFRDLGQRVESMAAVHEAMYKNGDFGAIRFDEYLQDLASNLKTAFSGRTGKVKVIVEAEPVRFGLDQAIPCALLVSELMSNALKHAFPDGRNGQIYIGLTRFGDDVFQLCVSDNGVGFPEHVDWRLGQSLGLRLALMLTEHQMRGSLYQLEDKGTVFVAEFAVDQSFLDTLDAPENESKNENYGG
ncbi:sensor histidine kinase [Desulfovibrio inopinatus]|uniref:sensor histidine kinase n=1 Tax=Desulfovibrio inopinatus TaxID=102109 RepID=UPI0004142680|nr:histidine kinase dimerization/phosphoacceptor domain -containing protein [Desulfovibrio inopinatus]